MNNVAIIGRFAREMELVVTEKGHSVLNNALAVNRRYQPDKEKEADFFQVTFWGKQAEAVANYCHKGDEVGVQGYLQNRHYMNKEGRKVTYTEVIVEQVDFLRKKQASTAIINQDLENQLELVDELKAVMEK